MASALYIFSFFILMVSYEVDTINYPRITNKETEEQSTVINSFKVT